MQFKPSTSPSAIIRPFDMGKVQVIADVMAGCVIQVRALTLARHNALREECKVRNGKVDEEKFSLAICDEVVTDWSGFQPFMLDAMLIELEGDAPMNEDGTLKYSPEFARALWVAQPARFQNPIFQFAFVDLLEEVAREKKRLAAH